MIIDRIESRNAYSGINKRISSALEYLNDTDFNTIEPGRYTIENDEIYAIVSDYNSKPDSESKPEVHRIYADVQFVVAGSELFGYAAFGNQHIFKEYDNEKDIEFFDAELSFIKLNPGMFAVVFPGELHQPGVMDGYPAMVRKVVVKVKITD